MKAECKLPLSSGCSRRRRRGIGAMGSRRERMGRPSWIGVAELRIRCFFYISVSNNLVRKSLILRRLNGFLKFQMN